MLEPEDYDDNVTLVEILYGLISEELIKEYVALNNALCRAGVTTQLMLLQNIDSRVQSNEIDVLSIPIEVDNLLRGVTTSALLDSGIHFDVDIDIYRLVTLTETVLHFDVTETPQTLVDKIKGCGDSDEAFMEVLSYLTDISVEEWMECRLSVDDGVIQRILQLATTEIDIQTNDTTLGTEAVYRLNEKLVALKDKLPLLESIESLESVPSLEALYINRLDVLIDAPQEDAVEGIYALALLCESDINKVYENVGVLLDDLYDTPTERQSAERYRTELRGKFEAIHQQVT